MTEVSIMMYAFNSLILYAWYVWLVREASQELSFSTLGILSSPPQYENFINYVDNIDQKCWFLHDFTHSPSDENWSVSWGRMWSLTPVTFLSGLYTCILSWPLSLYITYQPFLVSPEQFLMQLALYPKQTNIHQLASHWSVFSLGHNLSLSKTSHCVWSFWRTFISTLLGRKYHLMVITLKFKNWFSPKASAIQFTQ